MNQTKNTKNTLESFFNINEIPDEKLLEVLENDEFKPFKNQILKEIKGPVLPKGFFVKIIRKAGDLLQLDMHAILLNAWAKSEQLKNYLDQLNPLPEEMVIIPLLDHSVKSVHNPVLKPMINNVALGEIKFNVFVEFIVKGAVVEIQDQKVKEFDVGSVAAVGRLAYDDFIIVEKEGALSLLPGAIDLGSGVSLNEPVEEIHTFLGTVLDKNPTIARA